MSSDIFIDYDPSEDSASYNPLLGEQREESHDKVRTCLKHNFTFSLF